MQARWLFGPAPDLLLGCGLGWMGAFALQGFVGNDALAAWAPAGVLVMLSSIPHYGATLMRVYESAEDRRKYVFFSVYVTVALAALYGVGLHVGWLGSALLTLYLTWSPWHYTGQNYGITLMLLGRRGVSVASGTKRWIHASFVLSYLLTFVAIHGVVDAANYAPVTYQGTEFRLMKLGLPAAFCAVALPVLALGYAAALLGAGAQLLRGSRPRDLGPALLLMSTQALWFGVPVLVRHFGLAGPTSFFANVLTPYGFIWIATGHAVQYLWITTYFARTSGSDRSIATYLGKTVLAGYAIWILPALLFAPTLLGRLPYESGLALLTAAMVNLHHFVLDGAIWKLRDGRIASVLLRSETAAPTMTSRGPWRRAVPAVVWSAGLLALGVALVDLYEGQVGYRRALAERNLGRVRVAAERLAWIGRDGPTIHRLLAEGLNATGQPQRARQALEHSLELHPTAASWLQLASLEESAGDPAAALAALEQALALEPDNATALYRSGRLHLRRGDPARSLAQLERAAELAPDDKLVQLTLERARRAAQRPHDPVDGS